MLTPEESQKILDLRVRMMNNIQVGRPSQDGITVEEIAEALTAIRRNRAAPAAAGGRAGAKKRAAKPVVQVDTKAFTDLDLD